MTIKKERSDKIKELNEAFSGQMVTKATAHKITSIGVGGILFLVVWGALAALSLIDALPLAELPDYSLMGVGILAGIASSVHTYTSINKELNGLRSQWKELFTDLNTHERKIISKNLKSHSKETFGEGSKMRRLDPELATQAFRDCQTHAEGIMKKDDEIATYNAGIFCYCDGASLLFGWNGMVNYKNHIRMGALGTPAANDNSEEAKTS